MSTSHTTTPASANLEPVRLSYGLFEPLETDADYWKFTERCAARIAALQPGPVAACEWAGVTWEQWMRKGPHAPKEPENWRDGWPALYVGTGCESPIIGLDWCNGTRNEERRVSMWRAKMFNDEAALALVVFFACATAQIFLPDPAGVICRTCRGAGKYWHDVVGEVIPCKACGATGAARNNSAQ
jgi:hypothetical protein